MNRMLVTILDYINTFIAIIIVFGWTIYGYLFGWIGGSTYEIIDGVVHQHPASWVVGQSAGFLGALIGAIVGAFVATIVCGLLALLILIEGHLSQLATSRNLDRDLQLRREPNFSEAG